MGRRDSKDGVEHTGGKGNRVERQNTGTLPEMGPNLPVRGQAEGSHQKDGFWGNLKTGSDAKSILWHLAQFFVP